MNRPFLESTDGIGRALAFLLLIQVGCGPSAESQERARVLAAIDALRDSPPGEPERRIALASQLANEGAKTPEAIAARDACSKAYRLLAESNRAESAAEKGLAAKDKESALATLTSLDEAQKKLDEANETMKECSLASSTLRLKK